MKRCDAPAAEAGEVPLDPDSLFRSLAGRRGLVLAVSGGPDSTALMVLAARWKTRPPLLVVSVDHGLRPEASAEVAQVGRNAGALNLPFRAMACASLAHGGNLQSRARDARYACLAQAAREAGFDTIVTGHHMDDQAETFLLRLARGSGVYGLAAMLPETQREDVSIARPLLEVPREALLAIAEASGLPIVRDSSNEDPSFDRVRMRQLAPSLADAGLTPTRLAGTARRLGRAAAALDHYAGDLLHTEFEADWAGVVRGRAEAFSKVPDEIALRSLALILRATGGQAYTPRLDLVEDALAVILSNPDEMKRTLHGSVVEVRRGALSVYREWGRSGLAEVPAGPGATLIWDGRFQVRLDEIGEGLTVGPLGRAVERVRAKGVPQEILRTLPGLFDGPALIAAIDGVEADDRAIEPLAGTCIVGKRLGFTEKHGPDPAGLTR